MSETRLSVRMDTQEIEDLKAVAAKEGMTLSDWVRYTLLQQAGLFDGRYVEKRTFEKIS
jgi:antitoxin component of RelBE/YafQ-DinJ toxin-antitoxin module